MLFASNFLLGVDSLKWSARLRSESSAQRYESREPKSLCIWQKLIAQVDESQAEISP
jgi:hypothetical protein